MKFIAMKAEVYVSAFTFLFQMIKNHDRIIILVYFLQGIGNRNLTCFLVKAQIITPYELSLYKETGKITIPDALQGVGEDDNPIVILYHLK